jgi:hypothetical protein
MVVQFNFAVSDGVKARKQGNNIKNAGRLVV